MLHSCTVGNAGKNNLAMLDLKHLDLDMTRQDFSYLGQTVPTQSFDIPRIQKMTSSSVVGENEAIHVTSQALYRVGSITY